jgi:hypothetical protein
MRTRLSRGEGGGITFNVIINKLGRAERKRTQPSVMKDEIILLNKPLLLV